MDTLYIILTCAFVLMYKMANKLFNFGIWPTMNGKKALKKELV